RRYCRRGTRQETRLQFHRGLRRLCGVTTSRQDSCPRRLIVCHLPCCSINSRSEFDNPSPVRLGQSAFQPSVANLSSRRSWKLEGRMGARPSRPMRPTFTREHQRSVRVREEHRRRAPPLSSSACHSALASCGSNRGWGGEAPSFPVNRPKNWGGATIGEKAFGDGPPSPWPR